MAFRNTLSSSPAGGTLPANAGGEGESAASVERGTDFLTFPDNFEFYKRNSVYFIARYKSEGWTMDFEKTVANYWFNEVCKENNEECHISIFRDLPSRQVDMLRYVKERLDKDAEVYARNLGFVEEKKPQKTLSDICSKNRPVFEEIVGILRPVTNARDYYRVLPLVAEKLNKIMHDKKLSEKRARGIEFLRAVVYELKLNKPDAESIRDEIRRFIRKGLTPEMV